MLISIFIIAIENDLKTMETWLSDIEGSFTDGVTAIDFPMDKWAALSAKNTLQTDLAQRTAGMDGVNGEATEKLTFLKCASLIKCKKTTFHSILNKIERNVVFFLCISYFSSSASLMRV